MKNFTKILFFAFLFFVSEISNAQWYPISSGTTATLRSVFFTDPNTGYISGDNSLIFKTTDGRKFME